MKNSLAGISAAGVLGVLPCSRLAASEVALTQDFTDGQMLGKMRFVSESGRVGRVRGTGLNGRLAFDLSSLQADKMSAANDEFFIRTRVPDGLDYAARDPWKIRINGLVQEELEVKLEDLLPEVEPQGDHVLECSGNARGLAFGLLSATSWKGVPLQSVLDRSSIRSEATCVRISGVDAHSRSPRNSRVGASWVMTMDEVRQYRPFLATEMGGEPLTEDHGKPVRLIIPNWYGCTCIKWVDEISFLDDKAESTGQMKEFASRTHQRGVPDLAKDFRSATMDLAAMPVRVEKWRVKQETLYRIVGIIWGGKQTTDRLMIRFNREDPVPVESYEHTSNTTWNLWSHTWRPEKPGRYRIRMSVDDDNISTNRLDRGFYSRTVEI
ncbi:MAG: molybdopterin-dependent oxidoreductase [Pirellulales bacterium]|nr:molybdopterin-dependent oxidoreductase [Pirellulales bacterium]